MIDTDTLKSQIRLAFSDVEPPPHWCLASGNEGTEPALLAKEFSAVLDRNWEELDAAFLDQAPDGFGSALSFFSDEAFRFYLPGYLFAAIDGKLERADPVSHLIRDLAKGGERTINPRRYGARTARDYAVYRFSVFTPAQAAAVRAFLEWFPASADCLPFERTDIARAIATYWAPRAG